MAARCAALAPVGALSFFPQSSGYELIPAAAPSAEPSLPTLPWSAAPAVRSGSCQPCTGGHAPPHPLTHTPSTSTSTSTPTPTPTPTTTLQMRAAALGPTCAGCRCRRASRSAHRWQASECVFPCPAGAGGVVLRLIKAWPTQLAARAWRPSQACTASEACHGVQFEEFSDSAPY